MSMYTFGITLQSNKRVFSIHAHSNVLWIWRQYTLSSGCMRMTMTAVTTHHTNNVTVFDERALTYNHVCARSNHLFVHLHIHICIYALILFWKRNFFSFSAVSCVCRRSRFLSDASLIENESRKWLWSAQEHQSQHSATTYIVHHNGVHLNFNLSYEMN